MQNMKKFEAIVVLCLAMWLSSSVAGAQSRGFKLGQWTEIQNSIVRQLSLSYVDSLDVDRIMRAGIDAMLAQLDPYTIYVPEEENEDFQMMLSNTYGGIGAVVHKENGGYVIINEPYEGSPAAKNGLQCGDEIMEIDGVDPRPLEISEATDRMKGKPGTKVHFKIRKVRSGDIVDVDIVRERIQLPSVDYVGMLDSETGYIRQTKFTENVSSEIRNGYHELKARGMTRLILDLRGNGGGRGCEYRRAFRAQGLIGRDFQRNLGAGKGIEDKDRPCGRNHTSVCYDRFQLGLILRNRVRSASGYGQGNHTRSAQLWEGSGSVHTPCCLQRSAEGYDSQVLHSFRTLCAGYRLHSPQ